MLYQNAGAIQALYAKPFVAANAPEKIRDDSPSRSIMFPNLGFQFSAQGVAVNVLNAEPNLS